MGAKISGGNSMAEITIKVREKHAESDFSDIVSFNENSYRLKFDLDSEWQNYPQRVAVVLWAGGCREQLFTGDECDMPAITSKECDTALVGVYSSDANGRRIASSFVRFRILAGAYHEPDEAPPASLHEQILALLNEYDFSVLSEKVTPGSYSSVEVNAYGFVTGGKHIIEVGDTGETQPSSSLAAGGIFFRRETNGYTLCYFDGTSLIPITGIAGGSGGAVTSVNGETGDVVISKHDLGLAPVALSGSYNDLEDLPAPAAVSSVNGETGDVVISKHDLGLAPVALSGSYNDLEDLPAPAAVSSVNGETGDVVISKHDLGLASVALSGSYNDLTDKPSIPDAGVTSVNGETGDVVVSKFDLGLAQVAISGSYSDLTNKPSIPDASVTSVNGETGDVVISKFDLGLAAVAISGSYNDLVDKPTFPAGAAAVTSVNGSTGDVTVSKYDLGIDNVRNERQLSLASTEQSGADFNDFGETGCHYISGTSSAPCTNAPASASNTASDCRWFLMVFSHADSGDGITQLAISERADCAIRIRNCSSGGWGAWKTVL